jgi:hypothetical protein
MSNMPIRAVGEHRFYLLAALGLIAVTLAGFSIDADLLLHLDRLSALVLLHGMVMFAWLAMFATQTILVAVGRVDLHRRLGIAGAVLAALLVVLGAITSIVATRLGGDHLPPGAAPPVFLASALELLFVFSVLIGAGIGLRRRRSDWHKRLMLLATIPLLDAAIVRFIAVYTNWTFDADYLRNGLIFLCVLIDTLRYRRLHPAFAIGAAFIFVCDQLSRHIGSTLFWGNFTAWIVG